MSLLGLRQLEDGLAKGRHGPRLLSTAMRVLSEMKEARPAYPQLRSVAVQKGVYVLIPGRKRGGGMVGYAHITEDELPLDHRVKVSCKYRDTV